MASKLRFDEINALGEYLNGVEESQGTIKDLDADFVIDALLDILIMEYVFGTEQAGESLGEYFMPDTDKMNSAIYKRIEGKNFEDRVREYVASGDVPSIMRVAETDAHRVYNEAAFNAAVEGGATTKVWKTTMDGKERDTHSYLNDTEVGINDYFYSYKGAKTRYPGEFGVAEEDCNCRCEVEYRK